MRKFALTALIILLNFSIIGANSAEEENISVEEWLEVYEGQTINTFAGNSDFSDDKMSSPFVGIQHASDELYRDTFLGRLSPVTGLFVTGAQSSYIYTGVQANYKIGNLNINPSFAPGYYSKKGGKDLGTWLEFKSEVQMSYDVGDKGTKIGMSYNHLSNASLGDKNPGANSYLFNILKSF